MLEYNKIYCQDCFEVIDNLDNKSIDLVITDPPYLFDNGNWMKSDVIGEKAILGKNSIYATDGLIKQKMSQFGADDIKRLVKALVPKMKKVNMYFFCSETQVPLYGIIARELGLHFSILVWEKPLSIINKNRFSQNTEYVVRLYCFGTGLNRIENNECYNKVIHEKTLRGKAKLHPTQKPVEIIDRFVLLSSKEDDVILDPFIGSGSTAISCIKNKRNFIGFELDNEMVDKANERIAKFMADNQRVLPVED